MNAAALRETMRFVLPLLEPGARVLDVGSGRGEVVRALRERGYDALGIDKEEGHDFLEHRGGPYDALLFVASLHHMPLAEALAHARSVLAPEGLLIADEFDLEAADEPTARHWLLLKGKCGDPLHEWEHHHAHHGVLAPGRAMREAIATRFELISVERVPYLFRYLPDDADADPALAEEARLIAQGGLQPVGLRITARR